MGGYNLGNYGSQLDIEKAYQMSGGQAPLTFPTAAQSPAPQPAQQPAPSAATPILGAALEDRPREEQEGPMFDLGKILGLVGGLVGGGVGAVAGAAGSLTSKK